MAERSPFPFIVACGRSGTTMLRVILEQHPEIAVPPESYFPITFWRKRRRYERAGGFDLSLLAEDLLAHDRFQRWELDPALVRERLRGTEPIDYPEAMRRVFATYAEAHGKARYGDKTPPFVLHMPTLARLFPESRFVHLVRDGRDVAMSLREQPFGPRTLAGAARIWAERVARGREAGRRLGSDRYLEIRYEDLVADPEPVLEDVCTFVELDYRPEMLAYEENRLAAIPVRGRGRVVRPPTTGIRDWRTQMPPRKVALVEAIAGDRLEAFGYKRSVPRPPPAARVVARVATLPAAVKRSARRIRRKSLPGARSRLGGTGR